ncbi:PREDICTED: probable E3 ubiquitin-protein ligase TRIML1 [Cyprinodon variegatus]|nr:PREDICTED: probable E3 ubiquitin-protein ligase TRIML1 [Cyprinodon variegatus]
MYNLFPQDALERHHTSLKKQRVAVKHRLKELAARQSEITKKSTAIKDSVLRKYQEIHAVLEEDMRITLSHLEMEERAAVSALDAFMERNCTQIQEIEQELARISLALEQSNTEPDTMSFFSYPELDNTEIAERVSDVLNQSDPSSVSLDEAKASQILTLTNNMLLLVRSQTPLMKKLLKSYSSEVHLDPQTAHPKLIISPKSDSVSYTDTWQKLPDLPGRFDTTLNVISLQGFRFGHHYWEIDVTGKTYWELGVTYPSIPRKGTSEDCWLGRGAESWCVEFFDGEYTAWHGGLPHQLPFSKRFSQIGVFCSFPAGLVTFLEAEKMMPLFSFCAGTFLDCLHLALCPGHDHNGTNSSPIVICNETSPTSDL